MALMVLKSEELLMQKSAIQQKLLDKQVNGTCGLQIINLNTGIIEHNLRIERLARELYDVCLLPNIKRPMAIGFITDEIKQIISLPPN